MNRMTSAGLLPQGIKYTDSDHPSKTEKLDIAIDILQLSIFLLTS